MTLIEIINKVDEVLNIKTKSKDKENKIFRIDRFEVIKTNHIETKRGNKIRNDWISEKEYRRILSMFIYDNKVKNGEYHLLYKPNGEGDRYNDLIIYVGDNKIVIKTIIQFLKKDPMNYYNLLLIVSI